MHQLMFGNIIQWLHHKMLYNGTVFTTTDTIKLSVIATYIQGIIGNGPT